MASELFYLVCPNFHPIFTAVTDNEEIYKIYLKFRHKINTKDLSKFIHHTKIDQTGKSCLL